MNTKVLKETKLAYADCNTPDFNKGMRLRNLSFRASAPVPVADAVKIMTESLGLKSPTQEGYNNFAPALLRRLPEGSKVTLAREGSVCVYVTPPKLTEVTQKDADSMMADEFHSQTDGTVRLWWD